MQTVFDPLTKLAALGAYARLVTASDGTKRVTLSYSHKSTRKAQLTVLQDALVTAGLAWVDGRFCKADICSDWLVHQREARADGRGLWGDPAPVATMGVATPRKEGQV